MRIYNSGVAAKRFGALLEDVKTENVTIMRNGRPCAVIVDHRRFQDYSAAYKNALEERYLDLVEQALMRMEESNMAHGERALMLARKVLKQSMEQ